MADGCGSQNKNSVMISMRTFWLINNAPRTVKSIQIIFPIPGHSFMPADRLFGLIEKDVKNKVVIIDPLDYKEIYSNYGNLIELGLDCPVLNWKKAGAEVLKPPNQYHFKFAPCKRYFIARVKGNPQKALLKGEINYKSQLSNFESFAKKGKAVSDMTPELIKPYEVKMSPLKLNDVIKLLEKHFGLKWKEEFGLGQLKFYKDVLERNNVSNEEIEEEVLCDYFPKEIFII